ncbi:MAG TPA: ATP-grasp domain-containing protein [Gaiellaceae bacterium]|nr:ATP-grasp domain-containing protein [Gaiellaceae bacterium]
MRDLLIVCPSPRDRAAAAGVEGYRVRTVGRDADEGGFDPAAILREADALPADGVVGSKDRSALLAALVAARRGLPGPAPAAVLRCQHKPSARALEAAAAPEAVPAYAELDGTLPFPPPFFVKPVVGRLSHGSFRLDRAEQLPAPLVDAYRESFARMAALAGLDGLRFDGHLAEQLVDGAEVTLEGYVHAGEVVLVDATDSVFYPGTRSFQRFECPSRLPPGRLEELAALARRVVGALSLEGAFFNVELAVPARGAPRLIEVNARIASQFAPLVQATQGRSTYDALFALACGDDPDWQAREPEGVAVSWVIRVFADARVEAVPEPEPGLELHVVPGRRLSEQGVNDAASYRLAIFSEHGATRAEALERCRRRSAELLRRFVLS